MSGRWVMISNNQEKQNKEEEEFCEMLWHFEESKERKNPSCSFRIPKAKRSQNNSSFLKSCLKEREFLKNPYKFPKNEQTSKQILKRRGQSFSSLINSFIRIGIIWFNWVYLLRLRCVGSRRNASSTSPTRTRRTPALSNPRAGRHNVSW